MVAVEEVPAAPPAPATSPPFTTLFCLFRDDDSVGFATVESFDVIDFEACSEKYDAFAVEASEACVLVDTSLIPSMRLV